MENTALCHVFVGTVLRVYGAPFLPQWSCLSG